MNGLKVYKNHIKTTISLALCINKGSLIDFETTGIPNRDREHEVITFGYFRLNELIIVQRKTKEKEPFYREIRETIRTLPKPLYSYNTRFEKDVIRIELKMEVADDDFVDIMQPWRKKAEESGLKWPKLDDLMSEPEDYFNDDKICGKDVPGLWKAYLSGGTENLLKMIMEHCLSDILRETILLVRYPVESPNA